MHRVRARPQVISHWQGPAPGLRRNRAFERLQEGERIRLRNRQHGNLRESRGLRQRYSLGVLRGPHPGRQRIAREQRHVHHGTALRAVFIAPCPFGISVALEKAVIAGIRINKATDCAMLRSHLGLDAAPSAAITGDHDPAFNINPPLRQQFIIFRHPVVHVNEPGGHVAIDGISVVGGQLLRGESRSRVLRQNRFRQSGGERRRTGHLQQAGLGGGKQHLKLLDLGVVTPGFEQARNVFRHFHPVRRPDVMRMRGEFLHPFAQILLFEAGIKLAFQGSLRPCPFGSKTGERRRVRAGTVRHPG